MFSYLLRRYSFLFYRGKVVQTECNETCFKLLRCSLSYAKIYKEFRTYKVFWNFDFYVFVFGLLADDNDGMSLLVGSTTLTHAIYKFTNLAI